MKAEIDFTLEIEKLAHDHRQEMTIQNNKGSLARSYSKADRIHERISILERERDFKKQKGNFKS